MGLLGAESLRSLAAELGAPLLLLDEQQGLADETLRVQVARLLRSLTASSVARSLRAAEFVAEHDAFVLDLFSVHSSVTVRPWCPRRTPWITLCSSARHDFRAVPGEFGFLAALYHELGFWSSPVHAPLRPEATRRSLPPLVEEPLRGPPENLLVGYFNSTAAADAAYELLRRRGDRAVLFASACPRRDGGAELRAPDGAAFQEARGRSRGFLGSAGFETVAENLLLGLPMVLVPLNVEQTLNAAEYSRFFSGIRTSNALTSEDLAWLDGFRASAAADAYEKQCAAFRTWHSRGPQLLLALVRSATSLSSAAQRLSRAGPR